MRAIANLTVIVPADPIETAQAVRGRRRARRPGLPPRQPHAGAGRPRRRRRTFEIGRAARLRDGADVTIIATGVMVSGRWTPPSCSPRTASARACSTCRPCARSTARRSSRAADARPDRHRRGAHVAGGLGERGRRGRGHDTPVPMRLLGVPGVFAPTGSAEFLLEHFGLTPEGIRDAARSLVRERDRHARATCPRDRPGHDQHQGPARSTTRRGRRHAPRAPLAIAFPQPGWVEQDAGRRSGASVEEAIDECLSRGRRPARDARRDHQPARVGRSSGSARPGGPSAR